MGRPHLGLLGSFAADSTGSSRSPTSRRRPIRRGGRRLPEHLSRRVTSRSSCCCARAAGGLPRRCGSTASSARCRRRARRGARVRRRASTDGTLLDRRDEPRAIRSATSRCSRSSPRRSRHRLARPGATWWLRRARFGVFASPTRSTSTRPPSARYREYTVLDTAWPAAFLLLALRGLAAGTPARRAAACAARHAGAARGADARRDRPADLRPLPRTTTSLARVARAAAPLASLVARFALTFRDNLRMLRASERGRVDRRADRPRQPARAAAATSSGSPEASARVLALFDLDGFKAYNDTFGHPAGDALLARLGARLADASATAAAPTGWAATSSASCAAPPSRRDAAIVARAADGAQRARRGLHDRLLVRPVRCPTRPPTPTTRCASPTSGMYAHKRGGRARPARSVHATSCCASLARARARLRDHVDDVARARRGASAASSASTAEALDELAPRRRAARHRQDRRSPTRSSTSPAPLDDDEWQFMRQHTIIGERILARRAGAAPASPRSCAPATSAGTAAATPTASPARRSRSARGSSRSATPTTRWSPTAPTAAADRRAEAALAELARCAGTQFDPRVVEAFVSVRQAASDDDDAGGAAETSCAASATIS